MDDQPNVDFDFKKMIPDWIAAAQSAMEALIPGGAFVPAGATAAEAASGGRPTPPAADAEPSALDAWLQLLGKGLALHHSAVALSEDQPGMALPQQLMKIGVASAAQFQDQWARQLQRLQADNGDEAPDATTWAAGAWAEWMAWHEQETRQLLNIPPVGIARNYQQDLNQTIDTFNRFQTALSDFISMLCQPIERACKSIRAELGQSPRAKDLEHAYGMWVKALEEQYLSLFQSVEYLQCLSRTIDALNAFTGARNTFLEDMLKTLPIPTNTDMDELYKEIYTLKKQVRQLKKNASAKTADP